MSLYRYVPGKAELVDLMLDAVHGEAAPPGPDVVGWRALLEHHARDGWAMYERHPWAVTAYTRPVWGRLSTATSDSHAGQRPRATTTSAAASSSPT